MSKIRNKKATDQLETSNIDSTRYYIVPVPNKPIPDGATDLPDYVSIGQDFRSNLRPAQEEAVEAIVGTRLQVAGFAKNVVCCSYINGVRKEEKVLIPRIKLNSDKALGLKLIRRQFPLELAFCITINKSQGQSLKMVGINLTEEVFGYGMVYAALSRAHTRSGISVETANGLPKVLNVVERAVLDD